MRVAVLNGPHDITLEEREAPVPGEHEVLVRVGAVGVCGSDTHYYEHGRIGHYVVEEPMILGHESSGVIEAVGPGVDPARVGQRVSIEPGTPCFTCTQCLAGRYNLCPDMRFHATPPYDGSFAELVTIHEAMAHPVPDSVSDDAAALMEPLSVGVWACRKGEVGIGTRVLVTGAGPIGLVCLQVAKAAGAHVVVSDISEQRREVARSLGADEVVDAAQGLDLPEAPQVLLECSGNAKASYDGIAALAPAGRAVLVGIGGTELTIPLQLLQNRELVLTGTFRYANTWPEAIDLVASGTVDLDRLVTGHVPLDDAAAALTMAQTDPDAIKTIVRPGERRA